MKIKSVFALVILLLLVPPPIAVQAGPQADGGGFPTPTPTAMPVVIPTTTPTNAPQGIVITLQPAYPSPTETVPGLEPGPPANIQESPPDVPPPSGTNPLFTAAYIGLFIFLVVGIWMLFSKRGFKP